MLVSKVVSALEFSHRSHEKWTEVWKRSRSVLENMSIEGAKVRNLFLFSSLLSGTHCAWKTAKIQDLGCEPWGTRKRAEDQTIQLTLRVSKHLWWQKILPLSLVSAMMLSFQGALNPGQWWGWSPTSSEQSLTMVETLRRGYNLSPNMSASVVLWVLPKIEYQGWAT